MERGPMFEVLGGTGPDVGRSSAGFILSRASSAGPVSYAGANRSLKPGPWRSEWRKIASDPETATPW